MCIRERGTDALFVPGVTAQGNGGCGSVSGPGRCVPAAPRPSAGKPGIRRHDRRQGGAGRSRPIRGWGCPAAVREQPGTERDPPEPRVCARLERLGKPYSMDTALSAADLCCVQITCLQKPEMLSFCSVYVRRLPQTAHILLPDLKVAALQRIGTVPERDEWETCAVS